MRPSGDFIIQKIILPSGASIEVVYFDKERQTTALPPLSEEEVREFTEALAIDLITPEDFK